MKKQLTLMIAVLALSFLSAEELKFSFDAGTNSDSATGMTEFGRNVKAKKLPALRSGNIEFTADARCDFSRLFADAPGGGKAMRIGVSPEREHFFTASAPGKFLKAESGTVAFFVTPEDWMGSDRKSFRIFFSAKGPQAEFLIYKNIKEDMLLFLAGTENHHEWTHAKINIRDWKPGERHFVAAIWNSATMTLYVDGKYTTVKRKQLPKSEYAEMRFGTRAWKLENGLSLIDNVVISDKTFSVSELDAIYRAGTKLGKTRQSPINAFMGTASPETDGNIGMEEYSWSTNWNFNVSTFDCSSDTRYYFAYDDQNIYFAADTAAPAGQPHAQHDGQLWLDDSLELHLDNGKSVWQFIFNNTTYWFDSKNGQLVWNASNIKTAQKVEKGRWYFEAAIPFAVLGTQKPAPGSIWYLNACKSAPVSGTGAYAMSPVIRNFADRRNFTAFKFIPGKRKMFWEMLEWPGINGIIRIAAKENANDQLHVGFKDANSRILVDSSVGLSAGKRGVFEITKAATSGVLTFRLISGESFRVPVSPSKKLAVAYLIMDSGKKNLICGISARPPVTPEMNLVKRLTNKADGKRYEDAGKLGENGKLPRFELAWNISALPDGTYDFELAERTASGERVLHHQLFMKFNGAPPWDKFAGGKLTEVPAPWFTPKTDVNSIECLTQKYTFDKSLFPCQIRAAGENILASGMRLSLDGKPAGVNNASFKITNADKLASHFESEASSGNIRFRVKGRVEFDGLVWCDLEMKPVAGSAKIGELALEIPLTPACSELVGRLDPAGGRPQYASGAIPEVWYKNLVDHPNIWVGNGDRGLWFGAENFRGTHVSDRTKSLRIERNISAPGKPATMRVMIADVPFKLKETRTFSFGFQAVPFKILPEKCRPISVGAINFIWTWHKIFNYPNPEYIDIPKVQRMVKDRSKITSPVMFYACIYGLSPYAPEFPWFGREWLATPPRLGQYKQDFPYKNEQQRNAGVWGFGCANSESYRNWLLYNFSKAMSAMPEMKNFYFDMGYPRACSNAEHGCAWKDDFGRGGITYNILGTRDFAMRFRKMARDRHPDCIIAYHPSSEPTPPVISQADWVIDGEDFVSEIAKNENYFKIFTPELFRSSYCGAKWGLVYGYIPQFGRAMMMLRPEREPYWRQKKLPPEAIHAVRHYFAYILLHDTMNVKSLGSEEVSVSITKTLNAFGWDDSVKFHPYWHKEMLPFGVKGEILASGYSRPEKVLAVLLNDTDYPKTAELAPPQGLTRIADAETGNPVPAAFTIPPRGLKFVIFSKEASK